MVDEEDTKKVGIVKIVNVPRSNGGNGFYNGSNDTRQGDDGFVNGNGEWEAKWARGTQECNKEFVNGLDTKGDDMENGSQI
jgi:hypothetical protein